MAEQKEPLGRVGGTGGCRVGCAAVPDDWLQSRTGHDGARRWAPRDPELRENGHSVQPFWDSVTPGSIGPTPPPPKSSQASCLRLWATNVYGICACADTMHTMTRIHLVIDEREREAFRASASAAGLSLSEWLRLAARDRLERERPQDIRNVDDLDRFFAEQSQRESGAEPDWEQHLEVMTGSRRTGLEAG